jgi:hypothetical protein
MPNCTALINHCCIRINDSYTPCCRYENLPQKFSTLDYSYIEFKRTDYYQLLRQNMSRGWDQGCRPCQIEEQIGKQSLRQRYNDRMSGIADQLEFIEISLSNHCNLSCKMCNNVASSKWQALLDKNQHLMTYDLSSERTLPIPVNRVLDEVDLTNLKEIKYLGGEPFITPELWHLLDYLDARTNLANIKYRCNTNATFFPQKMIEQLSKFKQVIIIISLDGIGDLCNYIRTGENWNVVSSVIEQWIDLAKQNSKFKLAMHHTLQAYNLHQFGLIKNFAKERNIEFFFKILYEPYYLTLACLPKEYINELALTDPVITSVLKNIEYNHDHYNKFSKYTKDIDAVMGTDIDSVIPQLSKYIK